MERGRKTSSSTFARLPSFRGQDRVSDRLGQRQIAVATSKGPSKQVVDGGPKLKRAALLVPRHTSPLIARCTWLLLVMPAQAVPQPSDQRQDVGEHLPRHRDLGHLEGCPFRSPANS